MIRLCEHNSFYNILKLYQILLDKVVLYSDSSTYATHSRHRYMHHMSIPSNPPVVVYCFLAI